MARVPADLAVDLGTSSTRVVVRGKGLVVDEPTVVATQQGARGRDVVAVGAEAKKMIGRTPAGITVTRPVRGGVIADFEATERLLKALFQRAAKRGGASRPRALVCIPTGTTEVERRAVTESARAAGARDVWLVSTTMAAAVGADLPVTRPVGSMVVDFGGGRTDVGITSLGGLVVQRSEMVAGDAMDDAIAAWLKLHHGLLVGERTIETVKQRIGAAIPDPVEDGARGRPLQMRVRGRDLALGTPREFDLTPADIAAAVAEPVARIRATVLEALRTTPPELAADIVDRGILLCGGASLLRGLEVLLREDTGLPVLRVEDPERCVARGAALLLENDELRDRVVATA